MVIATAPGVDVHDPNPITGSPQPAIPTRRIVLRALLLLVGDARLLPLCLRPYCVEM